MFTSTCMWLKSGSALIPLQEWIGLKQYNTADALRYRSDTDTETEHDYVSESLLRHERISFIDEKKKAWQYSLYFWSCFLCYVSCVMFGNNAFSYGMERQSVDVFGCFLYVSNFLSLPNNFKLFSFLLFTLPLITLRMLTQNSDH